MTRGHIMLKAVRQTLEKHYYDSTYRGLDLDSLIDDATARVDEAQSYEHILGIVAFTVAALNDSHTRFWPPARAADIEYGFGMQIIGDACFVIRVDPESEAYRRGLRVGDRVLRYEGYQPLRKHFEDMQYLYQVLRPLQEIRLEVRHPDGADLAIMVPAELTQTQRYHDLTRLDNTDWWDIVRGWENEDYYHRDRFVTLGDDILIWQFNGFGNKAEVDHGIAKARDYPALVIDLRGNHGGPVATLEHFLGYFVADEMRIATARWRKKAEYQTTVRQDPYWGTVVLMVDSRSASAAEVASRFLQLQQRATVVGDTTAGAVMASRGFSRRLGAGRVQFYGISVSVYDVIMGDGGRLEGSGVAPDVTILPTGADLAAGRDPALSHAIGMVGGRLDPDAAGRLFPKTKRDETLEH